MNKVKTIVGEFDVQKFKQLQKAFNKAVSENKTEFVSEGSEYDRDFARYLLEFLTPKFKGIR